jgi:PBP1b-binding outer membrane lipoprotein LpoB
MKKTLLGLVLMGALFVVSCKEKTTEEKVEDAVESVGNDIEKTAEEAGDAIENAVDETGQAIENAVD